MSEWREVELGEIAEITSSKRIFYSDYVDEGIPFYRSKEIINKYNRQKIENELFITESKFEEIEAKYGVPQENDILLTSVGTLGIPYLVKKQDKFYFKDGNLTWFRNINQHLIDVQFLYIWLQSKVGQQKLEEITIGSTQLALTIRGLKTVEIPLPPLPEQKAIAEVLSSLDDKIDLLHRQNQTLEKMAETLFRQWFVEEADDSWEVITLYEAIELVGGGTPKTSIEKYWNGSIKWLSGGDIASNHKSIIIKSKKTITEEGLEKSSAKLLPRFSTVISARGTVGKYCILSEPMAYSQTNYGIKPRYQDCYFFTYLLINHMVEELNSSAYGSVFDTITTNTFKGLEIALPAEKEIQTFEARFKDYFFKILNNQKQICTLENLRDTLLPKLTSGEVKVKSK